MPFDPVDPRQNFPALERGIQKYWQEEDTFKRSIHLRSAPRGDPLDGTKPNANEDVFSFYDGPPFATGLPHYGHLLAGTIKDVIPRYQTMRGKRVERRFGWDCHGLPIENLIEKEHNLGSKQDIERMGVKAFNDLCRKAVQRYAKEWRTVVERMGRWVDMDWDYRTMDPEYMESIWWVFKSLHDKGLIYEGHKPMHVCPRCQTPLSNFEVTQGYKDVTDQAVYVMFEVSDGAVSGERGAGSDKDEKTTRYPLPAPSPTYMLAWTTTAWTLPGNLFLAVNPKFKYVTVAAMGKKFIVAKNRVEELFKGMDYTIEGKAVTGTSLVGKTYKPLFPYFAEKYPGAFRVVKGDFVMADEGTGIVHVAPGFGEDDYNVGKKEGIDPPLQHVGMDGKFVADVSDFAGMDVKPKDDPTKTDKKVAEWLEKHGSLFRKENYKHSYPHCWRCDSPLLNYATSSWFVSVERIKEKMLKSNAETEWVPAHLRDGRFGNWLQGARDWAISRRRYWGTPLPIWRPSASSGGTGPENGEIEVIGSRQDLMKRSLIRFTRVTILRHGESEGNVNPRYQGVAPGTDLTQRGKKQATAVATAVAGGMPVSQIYASPLARTQQTAQIIADKVEATVTVDDRLREVAFGEYEGKSIDFSDLTFVKARRAHKLETGQVESIYHFPGMETWSQVHARMSEFLREILPRHRGEHIVIVTHADPVQNMRNFFTGEDPAKLCNQPYPGFAAPYDFYWDHDANAPLDLHKETVDDVTWPGPASEKSVSVTVARHGQTDLNKDNIVQGGDTDTSLNDTGRRQAKELAEHLRGKQFDAIVTSDLKRAAETAAILSDILHVPIVGKWTELRERKCGEWSGRPLPDVMTENPPAFEGQTAVVHHMQPPGGETFSQLINRGRNAYDRLTAEFPGKRVLVVAHKGMQQALSVVAKNLTHKDAIGAFSENAGTIEFQAHPLVRRIPDVLDCWFESGSMPYAQSHFPFSTASSEKRGASSGEQVASKVSNALPATRYSLPAHLPPGFPADFIAEGIDQTRGWFYTLTVLSTALYGRSSFRHCIVNGTVLAEDGKKMSKRLKNYPEPLEVVEKHGADAVRFALMSSPAVRGEDLRFSEKYVEEQLRSVLLPLWNTYSFFVTYANAAKWEPAETRRSSGHPLDRWIRAEVQDLVNRMTTQLEGYDLSATCAELHDTIDALTNWYVRLSRRRFAGKAGLHAQEAMEEMNEQDRLDALVTLYDVLLTLTQLIAPFAPFIAEAIYLNLAADEHGSVHFTDWPQTKNLTAAEEELLQKNRVLRRITSLGMKLRAERKIKTRQPLARAVVAVPSSLLGGRAFTPEEIRLLQEELNVKSIEAVDDPGALADAYVQVDARKVGPRLGARVQEIIQAGKRGDFSIADDGAILIQDVTLSPDEAAVNYRGKEGDNVAGDQGVVISLDTNLTPELELEGRARDLIRAIQQLRKDAGLDMQDRITLSIQGADDILEHHGEFLLEETNATLGKAEGEEKRVKLDGSEVTVRFEKG